MTAGFVVKAGIGLGLFVIALFVVRRSLVRFWQDYERFSNRESDWTENMNSGPAVLPAAPADSKSSDLLRSPR